MKRVLLPGLAGLLGLALLAGSSFGSDQPTPNNTDKTKADKKSEKKATSQKHTANKPVAQEGAKTAAMSAAKAPKTHLPAGFAHANLTAEQHQKALAVMDKYSSQIKQLDSQIHELRTKRDGELSALLNDSQKKSLADAKANAQKARQVKKASAGKNLAMENPGVHALLEKQTALRAQVRESVAKDLKAMADKKNAKNAKSKEQPKAESTQPTQPEKTQPEKK
jgi:hypothetical protein